MPKLDSAADSLVFRSISAERAAVPSAPQELPQLDLVGAAIARAARLAAAEARTRRAYASVQRSQAAELLRAARDAARATRNAALRANGPEFGPATAALEGAADPSEGRVLPHTGPATGFVWRLHPAPADAGAAIANGPSVAFDHGAFA
jgi:hypothetical protein